MNKRELADKMYEMNKKSLLAFDVGAIAKIQQEMKKHFGKEAEKLLYDICCEKEKEIIKNAMPMVPHFSGTQISEVDKIMSLVDLFEIFTEKANFGKMFDVKVDVKNKTMTSKLKDNPVALSTVEIYGKSKAPQCTIQQGIMAGLAAAVFGVDMKCHETKCVCCGDDYCEFKVKPT